MVFLGRTKALYSKCANTHLLNCPVVECMVVCVSMSLLLWTGTRPGCFCVPFTYWKNQWNNNPRILCEPTSRTKNKHGGCIPIVTDNSISCSRGDTAWKKANVRPLVMNNYLTNYDPFYNFSALSLIAKYKSQRLLLINFDKWGKGGEWTNRNSAHMTW